MRQETVEKREPEGGVVSRIIAVTSLAQENDGSLTRNVVRYLADRSPRVRSAALGVVGKSHLIEAEQYVLKLLSDSNDAVRYSAVECLGSLHEGEEVSAKWLYPLLEDADSLVRVETLESLAQIVDQSALPLIVKRLQDTDALVRSYAAWAIAQLGGKKYAKAVESALEVEQDDIAKVGFADALFALGDKKQFSVLLEFLSSAEYLVRCAAANALNAAELTDDQVRSAIKAVNHAAKHSLFRGDRTTMEQVEKQLRERE